MWPLSFLALFCCCFCIAITSCFSTHYYYDGITTLSLIAAFFTGICLYCTCITRCKNQIFSDANGHSICAEFQGNHWDAVKALGYVLAHLSQDQISSVPWLCQPLSAAVLVTRCFSCQVLECHAHSYKCYSPVFCSNQIPFSLEINTCLNSGCNTQRYEQVKVFFPDCLVKQWFSFEVQLVWHVHAFQDSVMIIIYKNVANIMICPSNIVTEKLLDVEKWFCNWLPNQFQWGSVWTQDLACVESVVNLGAVP